MGLFATLEQRDEPVSSEDLAAAKSADIVLVGMVYSRYPLAMT